jgi:hypothetical protein
MEMLARMQGKQFGKVETIPTGLDRTTYPLRVIVTRQATRMQNAFVRNQPFQDRQRFN